MRYKLIIAGAILVVLLVVLGVFAVSKRTPQAGVTASPQSSTVAAGAALAEVPGTLSQLATPADRQIRTAQALIQKAPDAPNGYNFLAIGFMQKARETGDFGFNTRAEAALAQSLKLAPGNFDATKLQIKLTLSNHRFAEALDAAKRAVEQRPRDFELWEAMTDALVELGRYEEAIKAAQTAVDLRPYTGSFARVSYIRSLYGDTQGAIEAMRTALESANPGDPESIAWCAVHLGDELMNAGKRREAEHEYDRALFSFPDYHLGLAAKARARLADGDTTKAVEFYRRSLERVPLPDTAIALGDLLTKLGRTEEAKKQYDLAEFTENAGSYGKGTYSRQIALFWADHDMKIDEALEVARRERSARADIYTSDLLAWCLYKKGELAEAKTSIDEALRLGTRDARLLYHAGMIYKALGDAQAAAKHLKQALNINPSFDVLQADVARQTLRMLAV